MKNRRITSGAGRDWASRRSVAVWRTPTELRASAVRAEHVRAGHEEAASDQRRRALVALETVVVPVTVVERDELRRTQTGNWLRAANALLGELHREAVGAEWLLITRSELLSHQHLVASGARETLAVPRRSLVRYSTLVDHPVALDAALRILLLVTRHTDSLLVTWYEGLHADWLTADFAAETLLVKLFSFELVFLHPCSEDVRAGIAVQSEVVVMAVRAVSLLILAREWSIDQRHLAVNALETVLVPVFVLVRQILEIGSDCLLALLALVGEQVLVARDAERVVIS